MSRWSEDLISVEHAGTLDGLFFQRVRRSPERVAYRYHERTEGWKQLTWREMGEAVARWRQALAGDRLFSGDRVAMLLRNCPEWIMFDQAALSLGLVTVPLYTDDRCGQRRLYPAGRRRESPFGPGCGPLEAPGRGLGRVPLAPTRRARGGGGRGRAHRRRRPAGRGGRGLAPGLRARAGPAGVRSQVAGYHRLYLRHYGASKGGDALPSQPALQCPRGPDRGRCLSGGQLPVVPAPVPHPGAHRRLLLAYDVGLFRGLRPLGRPAGGGHAGHPAHGDDRRASGLRACLPARGGPVGGAPCAGALALPSGGGRRLAQFSARPGPCRLAPPADPLAVSAAQGGGSGPRQAGRAHARGGEWRGAPAQGRGPHLYRAGAAPASGLRAHRDQPDHCDQPSGREHPGECGRAHPRHPGAHRARTTSCW